MADRYVIQFSLATLLLVVVTCVGLISYDVESQSSNRRNVNNNLNIQINQNNQRSDRYRAQCFVSREPFLLKYPDVYFFSRRNSRYYGSSNLNAEGAVHIPLDMTIEMYRNQEDPSLRAKQENEIERKLIQSNLYSTNLNTYFIIHGFLGDWKNETWMLGMKDMILEENDANVFLVDWSGGSRPDLLLDYGLAATNTELVTRYLAGFIENLIRLTATQNMDNFHIIGHSLGAHISGYLGYQFDGQIGRITGLDPAGPCFSRAQDKQSSKNSRFTGFMNGFGSTKRRLSTSSAKLVVAIHTDIQLLGLNENCAHYDIYQNGGAQQVNCSAQQDTGIRCNHDAGMRLMLPPANIAHSEYGRQEDPERCYLMAYQCSSWRAYQAGECGYCNDNDARCIFSGLSLGRWPNIKTDPNLWLGAGLDQSDIQLAADTTPLPDLSFNNELNPPAPVQRFDEPWDLRDTARHYTKVGIASTICLFQYQVIVVVDYINDRKLANDNRYFMRLPLDSGELNDDRAGRLVQVSHLVSTKSRSRLAIEESLMVRSNDNRLINRPYDYYTALITFNSTDNCEYQSERVLCRPLRDLSQARLYSSTGEGLQRVKYVVLNYLSGLSKSTRDDKSQILYPPTNGGVIETRRVSDSLQQSWNRLKQLDGFLQGIGCLVSGGKGMNCNPFAYQMDVVAPR